MQLNDVSYGAALPVDSYGPDFFRIGGKVSNGPIFLVADKIFSWGGYDEIAPIVTLANEIDVLFLGTGREISHPPVAFTDALANANIGVEPMASATACRTYNVLLSEGRRIGLAALTSKM